MFQTDDNDPEGLEALFSQKLREIKEEIEKRISIGESIIFGNINALNEICEDFEPIMDVAYSCKQKEGEGGKVFLALGNSIAVMETEDLEELIGGLLGLRFLKVNPELYKAVVKAKVYPGESEVTVILPRDLGEGLIPALFWLKVNGRAFFLGGLSFIRGERNGISKALNYDFADGRAYMFVETGREVEGETVNVRGHFEDVTEGLEEILKPLIDAL